VGLWAELIDGPIQPRGFIVVFLAFAGNVSYWVISNWTLGGPSLVHLTPEPSEIVAEFSVAFGTIALACAAYNQALAAKEQTTATRAQNDLLRDQMLNQSRPHLSVRFWSHSLYSPVRASERSDLSPGDAIDLGEEDLALYIYNSGPGVADEIRVEALGLDQQISQGYTGTNLMARTIGVLGVQERSQVRFTFALHKGMFPGKGPVPPQTIILKVHSMPGTIRDETEEDSPNDDPYARPPIAWGGLHMENFPAIDGRQQITAWRILTPEECSVLAGGWIEPNSPKIGLGPGATGQLPIRRTPSVPSQDAPKS
jgi:hypothetical protein